MMPSASKIVEAIEILAREANRNQDALEAIREVAKEAAKYGYAAHHARWYLERIFDILSIPHDNEGTPP